MSYSGDGDITPLSPSEQLAIFNKNWAEKRTALGLQAAPKVVAGGGLSLYDRNVVTLHKIVAEEKSDSEKCWKDFGSLTIVHPVIRTGRELRSMLNEDCMIKRVEMFPRIYGLTMAKLGPKHFNLTNAHHSTINFEIDSEVFLKFVQEVIWADGKPARWAKLGHHSKSHSEQIVVVAERVINVDGLEKRIAAYIEHVLHALDIQANTDQFNSLVQFILELSTKDLVAASRMLMNSYRILKFNLGHGNDITSKAFANFIRELILPQLAHRAYIHALYKFIIHALYKCIIVSNRVRMDTTKLDRIAKFFSTLSFEAGQVDSMTNLLIHVMEINLNLANTHKLTPLVEVKQEKEMAKFLAGALYPITISKRIEFISKYAFELVPFEMLTAEKRKDRCKRGTSLIFQRVYGIPLDTPNFDRAVLYLSTIPDVINGKSKDDEFDIPLYEKAAKIQAENTPRLTKLLQDERNKNGQFKGMIEFYDPHILENLIETYILPAKIVLVPVHYLINIDITDLQEEYLNTYEKFDTRKFTQAFYEAFFEEQSGEKEVSPRPSPENGEQSFKKVAYTRLAQVLSRLFIRRNQIGDFVQFLLNIVSDLHSITETDTTSTAPTEIHQVKDNANELNELFSSLDHSKTLVRRVISFSKYGVPTESVSLAMFAAIKREDQCKAWIGYILRAVYGIPEKTHNFDKATASLCAARVDMTDHGVINRHLAENTIRLGKTFELEKVLKPLEHLA